MMREDAEARSISWSELLPFLPLFRGFRMAIDVRKLALATAAVVVLYLGGRLLDWLTPVGQRVVVSATGISEPRVFVSSGLHPTAVREWIESTQKAEGATRRGVFAVLMDEWRGTLVEFTSAALSLSPRGVVNALVRALGLKLWLGVMHPVYLLIFGFGIWLPVWALAGGAICRIAALQATRDERVSIAAAIEFSRRKFWSFVTVPLLPVGIILVIAVLLAVGGLIGAIPGFGTLVAPLLWFLAMAGGILIAIIAIGLVLASPLMYPTIAVEGSDAYDGMSRSLSYVGQHVWRTALYFGVAMVYGSICYVFVKLVARVGLFATHFFVGLTMNMGSASAPGGGTVPHKLNAFWQAPALDFSNPFYGALPHAAVAGVSRVGQFLLSAWVYMAFAVVAGWLLSYYHSASTLAYLLLRRDEDATDLDEVWVEEDEEAQQTAAPQPTPAPAAAASTPGSLASLPVVGPTTTADPSAP